jgi:peptidoglycan-N-acetylglucosamine deacetylase
MRFSSPFIKPASILSLFLKGMTWTLPNENNEVYLTFDDGPIPEVTPWVLDLLKEKNAKATFFCVGHNVEKHPYIYQRILAEGHRVGNHTYTHPSGWKLDDASYMEEIQKAASVINSSLFRPPYGEVNPRQYQSLKEKYRIIMWDVLTKDYDPKMKPQDCIDIVQNQTKSGSIIVMHDSLKAECNLRDSLPTIIDYLQNQGFLLASIT